MVGNATFTMEASITTRKMLTHTTPSTTHARRGTSTAAAAPRRRRRPAARRDGRVAPRDSVTIASQQA